MPRVECRCGYVHDLSSIPDAGWVLMRDADYEGLIAAEAKLDGRVESERDKFVAKWTSRLYECPKCGVLAGFRGDAEVAELYARLKGPSNGPS